MITVITCTNKEQRLSTIIENFTRQTYKEKELIIILNKDSLNLSEWEKSIAGEPSIKVIQIKEETTLGECLNMGVDQAKYEYIAKFDDDDYYAKDYLNHSMETLMKNNARVVGKTTIYMYFEEDKTLHVFNPYKFAGDKYKQSENKPNPKILMGGTLLFEKKVNEIVPFQACNTGEDARFCEDCIKNAIPIFSGSKEHYVYIRSSEENHTWEIKNQHLKKFSTPIKSIEDFTTYLSKEKKT